MDELFRRAVDPDSRTGKGVTALMQVVGRDDDAPGLARRLIAAGADVDAVDDAGRTALMDAAAAGKTALARVLLDAGADTGGVDRRGRTALTEAKQCGDPELVDLITRAAHESDCRVAIHRNLVN